MNDVTLTARSNAPTSQSVSNTGSLAVSEQSNKTQPVQVPQEAIELRPQEPPQREVLEKAVVELNNFVQRTQRDLQFSIDEDTGTTVVKVVDRNSGELIRQIPDATLIELAKAARQQEEFHLLKITG